jgi:DNA topoisomerase-2
MTEKTRKHKQISQLEHVKRKSMWVGSQKIGEAELYCIEKDRMKLTKIKFAPAWYKILDEIIVNAIDQWVTFPKKVTKLRITFDSQTGIISVYNNGPSIGIYKVKNLNGDEMYAPQLIASEFLSGDNLDDDSRVTGGTNGAGLKLTNAFSDWLTISTVDKKAKKHLTQTFKDRLNVIEKPIIRELTSSDKENFTKIEFLSSYSVFGYKGGYKSSMSGELEKLIISRAYQAAAFTKAAVYYNDKEIVIPSVLMIKKPTTFYNFSHMFLPEQSYGLWSTKMISVEYKKFPWEICIGISDGKFRQVSLINGIYVYGGGTHIKHIQKLIVSNLKTKVEKEIKKTKVKFNPNYILNNLFVFVKGSIVNPEFTSQTKSTIDDPIEKFKSYQFKKNDWSTLWTLLEDHIMSMFLQKNKDKEVKRVTRGAINVPKCIDAKYAGHKTKSSKCALIICEGDSAKGTVHTGITHKSNKLSYDYYGSFSIQGVPMNARKEVVILIDKKTKKKTIMRKPKLVNNERLSSMVKVLGLDFGKSYESDVEFITLRYSKIIAAVDQDDDGKGNIFGLLINFFLLFWPALVKRNFITRFNTPIIRAFPKTKKYVEEFNSLIEYDKWVKTEYKSNEDDVLKNYRLKYYKGLGSHTKAEIPQMFKDFEANLCVYQLDDDALKKIEAYFGIDTEKRKKLLSTPVTREETIGKLIDISEQLDIDLKAYQRDNIMRKLPHLMDGLVPSRRKALFTARAVFGSTSAEMKVSSFAGETSKFTHYHHGETSLAGTITKMAQEYPGGRNLPMLRPKGQFGTRSEGGKDAASPRYTFTQLTKRLCMSVYPKEDDLLLKYTFDDGERCEPEFYCPVIPMSILEHMELPATGWKVKLWARHYKQTIANVRNLINGKIKKAASMKIWLKDNKGEVRICAKTKKLYSVGRYIYDKKKNTIHITELPVSKFSSAFIGECTNKKALCNKPYFKGKPDDRTNDDGVDITFYLTETGWKELQADYGSESFDCVEECMGLKTALTSNINMIGVDGAVKEFKKYESVVDEWFPVRKQLYADRIDRQIILTNLMIKYLKNIIKFTKNHQKYNITPKTKIEDVEALLKKNMYDTFNHTLLTNPKYTKIDEMKGLIMNGNSTTYEYLLKLTYRDMIEDACKKRKTKLAEYEKKLNDLEDDNGADIFKGAKTWLKELELAEAAIVDGMTLGWDYGKDKMKFRV